MIQVLIKRVKLCSFLKSSVGFMGLLSERLIVNHENNRGNSQKNVFWNIRLHLLLCKNFSPFRVINTELLIIKKNIKKASGMNPCAANRRLIIIWKTGSCWHIKYKLSQNASFINDSCFYHDIYFNLLTLLSHYSVLNTIVQLSLGKLMWP